MDNLSLVITSPKASPHKNLTGTPRIIKDLAATIHSSVQQWNNIHIHGVTLLKNMTALKVDESYPEGLQDMCDELERDVIQLDQVVSNLKLIVHQMNAAILLHKGPHFLFLTWPNERFGQITQLIYNSYKNEAGIKRKILENVAHDSRDSWKMLHLAAWVHQPMIPHDLHVDMESLLTETGHRHYRWDGYQFQIPCSFILL